MEARWIPSLRTALRTFGLTFSLDNDFVPDPECDQDTYIMEFAIQSKKFTPRDLCLLNYCRLYLHVTTTSELFNMSQTEILPHMRACTRPPWFDPSLVTVIQNNPVSTNAGPDGKFFAI